MWDPKQKTSFFSRYDRDSVFPLAEPPLVTLVIFVHPIPSQELGSSHRLSTTSKFGIRSAIRARPAAQTACGNFVSLVQSTGGFKSSIPLLICPYGSIRSTTFSKSSLVKLRPRWLTSILPILLATLVFRNHEGTIRLNVCQKKKITWWNQAQKWSKTVWQKAKKMMKDCLPQTS